MFDVPLDAHPSDRLKFAAYIQKIFVDHKPGPDGVLIAVDKIQYGKKGTANFQNVVEVKRLQKDNPSLWEHFKPIYERWKQDEGLVRDGMDLRAWPAITEGQVDECKRLGLFVVEDLAQAGDDIRQKLGMGANELLAKARAWVANKDQTATANKQAALEAQIETLSTSLDEARQLIDALMAEKGRKPQKPQGRQEAA